LIRPKWTLSKFVFDESNHKSTNEIKQILNYIFYYKYLVKIITSYINTKKILSMNVEEFETLLNKADKLGVESYLPNIMSTSLKSMAEFFNIGEVKKFNIPLMAVELFLEEKELFKHLEILTKTFGHDENAKFNIYDLQKVLSSVMLVKSENPPNIKETTQFEIEPAKIDLQEEKYINRETEETIQEQIIDSRPIQVETDESKFMTDKKNDIPEEEKEVESEEEFISLKYADEHEVNDEEENEEEEFSLLENSIGNNNDELNNTSGNESEISMFGYLKEDKTDSDEFEDVVGEEDENILLKDQDQLKIIKPVQELFIDKVTDEENYEQNKLNEEVEKESWDNSLPEIDEKTDPKIEEISIADEEIRIKLNTKFRIRVNEDNRIEPVIDEPNIKPDDYKLFGEEPEDLLDKFIGGKPVDEDNFESSNIEGTDDLLNIIEVESSEPDLKNDDTDEIISLQNKNEENEDVITTEKKDTFEVANKPEEEKPEEITPDPDDGFFELTIPDNSAIIDDVIPENRKVLFFGDDGLENETLDVKEIQKIPEDSAEEEIGDKSNFNDILKKEIKVFEEDEIDSYPKIPENKERKKDIAEILEHKDMSRIIKVIFDYDIEDFANTIEEIANCKNIKEANILLKDILTERRINHHSKEIEAFRSIIQELFN
jgi:hypothetical protein